MAVLAGALALAGCTAVHKTATAPARAVNTMVTSARPAVPDPATLQIDIQRLADEYASRTTAALDEYARRIGTAEGYSQSLRWKVAAGMAAVSIASGPNPQANLLDFLSLTAVTRLALEEVWMKTAEAPAFEPWYQASVALETNAWSLAQQILTSGQQEELRAAIRQWWEANPHVRLGFFVRPQEFSSLVRQSGERTTRPGSVFGMVNLDPMSGLDPAVREVARTRLFAERAMFVAQRMAYLLRWQIELMTDELLHQPEIVTALENTRRLVQAVESASQTAAQLPDRITAERKAVLAALEQQEGKLRDLSAEVTRTLAAGEKMSTSLNTTLLTFDALMKRFGVGEPVQGRPDTNAVPFRIQDYGQTAVQLEEAARQLTELLQTLDHTLGSTNLTKLAAEVSPIVQQAQTGGKEIVDYAFWKGILLLLITFVVALIYRFFSARMNKAHSTSHTP